MRRIMVGLVGLAAASTLSVLACTREIPVAPQTRLSDAVVGAYSIASVDGHALPLQLGAEGSMAIDALGGKLTLDSLAAFVDVVTYRTRGPGGVQVFSDTVTGHYLHFENTLLLQPENGSAPYFLDVTDDKTLTSWDYTVVVYRR